MISANAIPVLEALEGERGQSISTGTTHFGVTKTALEQYKKEHKGEKGNKINKMSLETLNKDSKSARIVRDEYFDYLEYQLNSKGNFYCYSVNQRDGILLEVYNTGISGSPGLVKAVRDGSPIEEVAMALLIDKNGNREPNPTDDLSKYNKNKLGRLNRIYTEIKMMYNPDYSEINTRNKIDEKVKEWDKTNMTGTLIDTLTILNNNKKILNEQEQQISSCISNYSLPKNNNQEQTANKPENIQQPKEDKDSIFKNIGKSIMNAFSAVMPGLGAINTLQNINKYDINKAGENTNDGNTNNNMQ